MISEEKLGKLTMCVGEWLLHCYEKLAKGRVYPGLFFQRDLRSGERGTAAESQVRKLREHIFNQKRNQSAF